MNDREQSGRRQQFIDEQRMRGLPYQESGDASRDFGGAYRSEEGRGLGPYGSLPRQYGEQAYIPPGVTPVQHRPYRNIPYEGRAEFQRPGPYARPAYGAYWQEGEPPYGAYGGFLEGGPAHRAYDSGWGPLPESYGPRGGELQSYGRGRQGYGRATSAQDLHEIRGREKGFRGSGPKNYTRSDERIREDLSERLMEDAAIDAAEVEVHVKDGVVRLTGTIDDRWMKHRVEDLADDCIGVKDIDNQLRVKKADENAAHHEAASGETKGSRSSRSSH